MDDMSMLPSGMGKIGNCLSAANDLSSGLDCITGFTDCFDGAAILNIFSCLGDAGTDSANIEESLSKMESCLSPYVTCIEGEIQKILDSLPSCLNSTMVNLGNCYYDNGRACNSTCTSEDKPTANPYSGVDASTLALCNSFQTDIMDPTCGIVDCCEPCVDEVEAFMNCFVQNALDLKQADSNSDCVLSCAARRRRHLMDHQLLASRQLAGHLAADGMEMKFKPEMLLRECGLFLETSDGLNGLRAGIEELRTRLVEGNFFECLFDSLFSLAEKRERKNMHWPILPLRHPVALVLLVLELRYI